MHACVIMTISHAILTILFVTFFLTFPSGYCAHFMELQVTDV